MNETETQKGKKSDGFKLLTCFKLFYINQFALILQYFIMDNALLSKSFVIDNSQEHIRKGLFKKMFL